MVQHSSCFTCQTACQQYELPLMIGMTKCSIQNMHLWHHSPIFRVDSKDKIGDLTPSIRPSSIAPASGRLQSGGVSSTAPVTPQLDVGYQADDEVEAASPDDHLFKVTVGRRKGRGCHGLRFLIFDIDIHIYKSKDRAETNSECL